MPAWESPARKSVTEEGEKGCGERNMAWMMELWEIKEGEMPWDLARARAEMASSIWAVEE